MVMGYNRSVNVRLVFFSENLDSIGWSTVAVYCPLFRFKVILSVVLEGVFQANQLVSLSACTV